MVPILAQTDTTDPILVGIGAILLAVAWAIRKLVSRNPGADEQYRSVSIQLSEKIAEDVAQLHGQIRRLERLLEAFAGKLDACTACPWKNGSIPEAWKREAELLLMRIQSKSQRGGKAGGM